ncbi:hypothetical protein F5Y19DRAFT_468965 [Xylariaceae sp. FL1651]|nr:hypothetical protein F5Y19DRAFT_468965 [Xylariaceae sp. FL1651]
MSSSSFSPLNDPRAISEAIRSELDSLSEEILDQASALTLAVTLKEIVKEQDNSPLPSPSSDKRRKTGDNEGEDSGAEVAHRRRNYAPVDFHNTARPNTQHPLPSEPQQHYPAPKQSTTEISQVVCLPKSQGRVGRLDRIVSARGRGRDVSPHERCFNLIAALCRFPLIVAKLGVDLEACDILNLYCVSRDFHSAANVSLTSCTRAWLGTTESESAAIASKALYQNLFIPDPAGRLLFEFVPDAPRSAIRSVPRMVRDILAHLARAGLRTPRNTRVTLLKLWALMDIPTTTERIRLTRNDCFLTNSDLVNAHIFFIKLALHFNDPFYGPDSCELLNVFTGQRRLGPLWQMLFGHKYRSTAELLQLKVRYDLLPPIQYYDKPILGVPAAEVGRGYLEGWGTGTSPLARPSDLVALELVRRDLRLKSHTFYLILWGHLHHAICRNLAPSEDEIRMSDPDNAPRSIDISCEYQPLHDRKAQWTHLSAIERKELVQAEERIEAYISSFDHAVVGDYYEVSDDEPGVDIYPTCVSETDGTQHAHSESNVVTSSWETSVKAQLRHLDSQIKSRSSEDHIAGRVTNLGFGDETDFITPAMSHLTPLSELKPEHADAPQHPGRFRFPTTFDYDYPNHSTPFTGISPIQEASWQMIDWDGWLAYF